MTMPDTSTLDVERSPSRGRRVGGFLFDALTMLLVSALSLFLLIYVGFGEAQRTYQQFHLEKLTAQGAVIQNAMENYLRPGLPLTQYVGFTARAERLLASDDSIVSLAAYDSLGQPVFVSGDATIPLLSSDGTGANGATSAENPHEVRQNNKYIQVILPLRSRFGTVGSLAITVPTSVLAERVANEFKPLLSVAAGLSILFALFISISRSRISKWRFPWLQIAFVMTFFTMAVVVILTLVTLYNDGAQSKTKALANSLGQRLVDIVTFNLNINEIQGLDRMLGEYRRLNPDISAAGLIVGGVVRIHTDARQVGREWNSEKNTYEYFVNLTPPGESRQIRVAVALPVDIVLRQIVRSVKNFAALLVASAFLAGLFLQLAGSLQQSRGRPSRLSVQQAGTDDDLALVKPVFFLAVFLEHLTYAFLPQFMKGVVASSGLSETYVSAPFMAYYLCFALTLVPSGHIAQQTSPRPLMYGGMLLSAIGIYILILSPDFTMAMLARAVSGIGQGMVFIGVQSYILLTASPSKRTQGAAIIVLGFQGGMISGMAIGSLLVTYIGEIGVFSMAGGIAVATALYALLVVPVTAPLEAMGNSFRFTLHQLGASVVHVMRNVEFLRTMLLIGIPAKAALTGIIIFALPLLLTQMNFPEEDIGQIIMIYACSVVIGSGYMSRLVDRIGRTQKVLAWGAAISGFGIALIGLIGWQALASSPANANIVTLILIAGVCILGAGHGFINAPVVTHIAQSNLALRIGESSATATYRFLERIGHAAGPIIIGQFLILNNNNPTFLIWVGGLVAFFGLVFLMGPVDAEAQPINREEYR